jgi:hypothetical protein
MINQTAFPGLPVVGIFASIVILFALSVTVLTVIAYWKICEKAGFPGPLSLLMLVPIANIILLLYLAFAEWPALKDKKPNVSSNI